MSQRYNGQHSPNAPEPGKWARDAKRSRAGARAAMLFILPLPMAFRAFFSDAAGLGLWLAAFGFLMLSAWLTRDGLIAHDAYDARKVARRPAFPRKLAGTVLMAGGLALAGFAGHGVLSAVIFAVLGGILHFMAFGPDPLRNKGMEGVDEFQQDRVAKVVDEAEAHLAAMQAAVQRTRNRQIEARVEEFSAKAREMCRIVEEDPRDLTAARRYLGVYLLGAREAAVKFADLYERDRNQDALQDFEQLLDDLETSFSQRSQLLLSDNKSSLDIEIEVLRDRLERENARHSNI